MNEALDSQLSAMFDDELPQDECELLARRLSRDQALRARWDRYATIGAALRGGDVRLGGQVARAVSSALGSEPVRVEGARAALPPRWQTIPRWWRPIAGLAVAASVAALSILWLQQNSLTASTRLAARSAVPAVVVAETPASYVVPHGLETRTIAMPATELANYVVAHSQFSTPVSRGNLLSGLMANESAAAGVAENTTPVSGDPNQHADQPQ
jgi:sigma-E factor negative regulatory protein RseA